MYTYICCIIMYPIIFHGITITLSLFLSPKKF